MENQVSVKLSEEGKKSDKGLHRRHYHNFGA